MFCGKVSQPAICQSVNHFVRSNHTGIAVMDMQSLAEATVVDDCEIRIDRLGVTCQGQSALLGCNWLTVFVIMFALASEKLPIEANHSLIENLNLTTTGSMLSEMSSFYVGLTLAVSSSLLIGTSFIIKKKGLMRLSVRAGSGGYGYLRDWLWWTGMLLMISGEGLNFIAYAFAPATLVTPLGALSVLVSAALASHLLNERLNVFGKLGCLICLLGSTIIVIHAPKEQELKDMDDLYQKIIEPAFIIYVTLLVLGNTTLAFLFGKYGTMNPLVYITISGSIGSLSVMACKGLGVAIKDTIGGNNQLNHWLTWVILACVLVFVTIQMNYLNKALDIFNTSIVSPILYVVFTIFVIIASAILYKEWGNLPGQDIATNIIGFLTIVSGIFLLQISKDLRMSLSSLIRLHRDDRGIGAASGFLDDQTVLIDAGSEVLEVHQTSASESLYVHVP